MLVASFSFLPAGFPVHPALLISPSPPEGHFFRQGYLLDERKTMEANMDEKRLIAAILAAGIVAGRAPGKDTGHDTIEQLAVRHYRECLEELKKPSAQDE
jgi:hypothetical protein